ncbi:MAG TPA: hypothetical protein VLG08_01635 [Casimicrobiaceae bacterium]|nr:hypothetical protein [Casimicrobiaceae bacterium]
MKRRIAVASLVAAAAVAVGWSLVVHRRASLPDLSGRWKSWRSELRIGRDGDAYAIVVDNPTGFLGGVYSGEPRGATLALTGPLAALCREMKYVKDGDKLQFCGEEFERATGSATNASSAAKAPVAAKAPRRSRDDGDKTASMASVAKASCGPGSHPETALQGQVPPPLRRVGTFAGFDCNLRLVAQQKGEGAGWQAAFYADKSGHVCAYHDTSPSTAKRAHRGVVVVDVTDPLKPESANQLATPAMLDPIESLKVNAARGLLIAATMVNEKSAELDVYDIGADCRSPRLLSSQAAANGAAPKAAERVTEGDFSPDGNTYYATNLRAGTVHPVDITDPAHPKVLAEWSLPFNQRTSGLAIDGNGERAYFTLYGRGAAAGGAEQTNPTNGVAIGDVSDVQARKAAPQVKVKGSLVWADGSASHQVFPIVIAGKRYLVAVDEGGSGDSNGNGWSAACSAGLPPWNMARLIDVHDEAYPVVASELKLEIDDAEHCKTVLPDLVGLSGFTYGSHYCSVDDPRNATALACAYLESGIRVFDIRDPRHPREIAYFVPPSVTTPSPGSLNSTTAATGRPDHCSAQLRFDARTKTLMTTCQDNGFLVLEFTNGAWPFAN